MINPHSGYLLGALLLLAFTGSWHCALMCGPIALGLSQKGNLLYYHLGRGLSYVVGGIAAGYMGHSLFKFDSPFAKVGAALLLSSFFILPLFPSLKLERWGHIFFSKIAKRRPGLFIFGAASILLPCGWLWTFIAAAAASGSPWAGGLITAILWISSLPALSAMTQYLQKSMRDLAAPRVLFIQRFLSAAGIYAVWSHFFL